LLERVRVRIGEGDMLKAKQSSLTLHEIASADFVSLAKTRGKVRRNDRRCHCGLNFLSLDGRGLR
jgi:hypothetical protein